MELWIRSQDKISFINTNCIQYIFIEGDNQHCIIGSGVDLGIYATKERCLEILDEIQRMIDNAPIFIKNAGKFSQEDIDRALLEPVSAECYNANIYPLQTRIYQMPEK